MERRILRANFKNMDTLIVPTLKYGFQTAILESKRTIVLRLEAGILHRVHYIAGYQLAPVRAVTHLAEVAEVLPSKYHPDLFMLVLAGPVIATPDIPIGKFQKILGPVYCNFADLIEAKTLDDLLLFPEPVPLRAA